MKKYKVLLSLFCVVVFVFLAVGSTGNDEEPIAEPVEPVEEEVVEEEPEAEEEPVLSEDDVQTIASNLEEEFEEEKEFTGEEYWLYSIEYDAEENQLNLMVAYMAQIVINPDMQLLWIIMTQSEDELISAMEAWAWKIVEDIPGVSGNDFNILITVATRSAGEEFIHFGSVKYLYETGEYTFREGEGMELFFKSSKK